MTMPTMKLEAAFGNPNTADLLVLNDPTRGKLGTGKLGGALGGDVYSDITPYALDVSIRRGSNRLDGPMVVYEAGTLSATLKDTTRRFDPTNLSGPYVASGATLVKPMRGIRFQATWSGTTYEIWQGFADSWINTYQGPQYTEVALNATDAFKVFQKYDRLAVTPVGAGELSSARITRILDSINWAVTDRSIGTGKSTMQATDLSGTALEEMQKVAESEIGDLYMDGGGRLVFRGRHQFMTDSRSVTSQATFGATPTYLSYEDVKQDYSEDVLVNRANVTREGGTTQTAINQASIDEYLTFTKDASGLLIESDTEALSYAQYLVYLGKDPELRFTQLVIDPLKDPTNLWPQALGREIGDRITVQLTPAGGGSPIVRDVFIRGITHQITPMSWRTTWDLQSATNFSFLVLNDPVLGRLNFNALAY